LNADSPLGKHQHLRLVGILSKPLERRMPQLVGTVPTSKLDLGNQFRPYPDNGFAPEFHSWRRGAERVELRSQIARHFLPEA